MSAVVVVHGIAQPPRTREAFSTQVRQELRRFEAVGSGTTIDAPIYRDCYRDPGSMAGSDVFDQLAAGIDPDDAVQVAMLAAFDEGFQRPGDMGLTLQPPLGAAVRWPVTDGLQRLIVANIKAVGRHLGREAVRECAFRAVESAIDDDTRLVIGHSLGSVVTYEYLLRRRLAAPPAFLTLGSPLGLAPVRSSLAERWPMHEGRLPRPEVSRWINISVADDLVPAAPHLVEWFDGVEDVALPGSGLFGAPFPVVHRRTSYFAIPRVIEEIRRALV